HDALSGPDARGRVAARGAHDPVLEVLRGQRDVARPAGGAARRVDADDLRRLDAEVPAERRVGRAQLALLGQRESRDVVEADVVAAGQLLAVEGRALAQVGELLAKRRVVADQLLLPRPRLD